MKDLNALDWIATILVIVGAINWGLVGVFNFDVIRIIFGDMTVISRIIYIIIGLAGIYVAILSSDLSRK